MRLLSIPFLLALSAVSASAQSPEDHEFFEKKVRPLLVERCQMCHSAQIKTSDLDLSSAEGFVKGGGGGPLINHDALESSFLLDVITYEARIKMPPTGKLADAESAILRDWVGRGAPWPGAEKLAKRQAEATVVGFTQEQKGYWAFQPVADPPVPAVEDESWGRNEIDRFVLARLEAEGLRPAAPADKSTLLRRAYFDLTGLPPKQEQVEAFLADDSSDAFERIVDELLASPHYGERWGRHWLDVARYADSTGNDEDHRYPYAWRYRDYVIDAFNDDMPFDRFVREQIAGDLMPAADGSAVNRRGIVATGFLALGPKAVAQQDKTKMLYDVYDEQIDVVSKAFLGLTMACARCHDHKFDPILQRDYYSMVGFFANTRSFKDPSTHVSKLLFVPLVPEEEWAAYEEEQEQIRRAKFEVASLPEIEIEAWIAERLDQAGDYMLAAREVYEDGKDAASVAAEADLDPEMLARWTSYLKPSEQTRAHMSEWDQAAPAERAAVAQRFEENFTETFSTWRKKIEEWRKEANRPAEEITMGIRRKPRFEPGDNRFFAEVYFFKGGPWSFKTKEDKGKILSAATQDTVAELQVALEQLEASAMPEPDRASAVAEVDPEKRIEQHVFVRGDYSAKGEPAPKVFPAILAGLEQEPLEDPGSGRLALAEWMASPDHELTPRVITNRIWHWHFGEGLVRTPSNFGVTGEKPTHPELLDWLSKRFVEEGWTFKSMHKRIMLSSTYRQSSDYSADKALADPENRLLGRFNRRRLDVEEIRDGLLGVDGAIDYSMGGTLQEGFGTDGENASTRLSIDPDEQKVRTVYLPLRRANLPALLNLFDFGDGVTTQGRRAATNVAPQALFMMNSEFVAERARGLARQMLEQSDDADRVRSAYLRTLTREPRPDEIDRALTYVAAVKGKFPRFDDLDAWQSYCRILMASNEFIYVD